MRPLGAADPTVVGSYRLLGVLGGGGMGRVYLGQSPTGRRLAIKIIRAELADNTEFRRRFVREVAAVRAVSPLFTAAVVDADTDAEEPWLATTYIDGPSLEELVVERGPLPPGAVLTLAAGLAEALASIHRVGLVHRDLKPSNVIVDDEGPHIIDFGVVLAPDATQVTMGVVVGTPSYMAPERLQGGEASPAGDVFSLGATLVYAATGRTLVNQGTVYEQIIQIVTGRFDMSMVPTQLRPLITRCLSDQPKDRPTAEELTRFLVGSGVPAPAPGWYRATGTPPVIALDPPWSSPLSRRRALTFGGVLGMGAMAGVTGVATSVLRGDRVVPRAVAKVTVSTTPAPGKLLWQARSGARPLTLALGIARSGARIVVDRGKRLITANGSQLLAVDLLGRRMWTKTMPASVLDLRQWGDALLVTEARRLSLRNLATGDQLLAIDVADNEEMASRRDNPDHLPVKVYGVVHSAERIFLNLGTATIAIDRSGGRLWRNSRLAGGGSLLVATDDWLVTRDVAGSTVEIGLYDARTGERRWSTPYELTPPPGGPPHGPGGPPPDGTGGPPPDGPGGPPHDDAWDRSEGRIGTSHVVLRDRQDLTVLRLSDGSIAYHMWAPKPVAAIELMGELLLVAADSLTAYVTATGAEAWRVRLRSARIAVAAEGRSVVGASERTIYALDWTGDRLWQAALPGSVRNALPERLTTDDHRAFLTFSPRGEQIEPLDVDVIAVALDAQA